MKLLKPRFIRIRVALVLLTIALTSLAGCIETPSIMVPPLRNQANAEYTLEGHIFTAFNGYGPVSKYHNATMQVKIENDINVLASEGLTESMAFRYSISTNGRENLVGTDYLHESQGRIAYVSHRGDSTNPYAWNDGLPDALFSSYFAGSHMSPGYQVAKFPTAPWREYRDFSSEGLGLDLSQEGTGIRVTLENTGIISTRVKNWSMLWDETCPFPKSVSILSSDEERMMELHRTDCYLGTGPALSFLFSADPPLKQKFHTRDILVVDTNTFGDVSVRGYASDQAWARISQSQEYANDCENGCSLIAARYSETDVYPLLPLMEPKSVQQWGFWLCSETQITHLVAEFDGSKIVVNEGRAPQEKDCPLTASVVFLKGDLLLRDWMGALGEKSVPLVDFNILADDPHVTGVFLSIQEGRYDQSIRENNVQDPRAGITLVWMGQRGGYLGGYIGSLEIEPMAR